MMLLLPLLSTEQLQEQVRIYLERAANPMPWEDAEELTYQAGIRQEILTVRGVS